VERALALTPHLASAHGVLGAVLTLSGQPKEGLVSFETYMKLDPNHPAMGVRLQQMTAALYFSGEYEAAIKAGNRALRTYPDCPHVRRWLAAALFRHGRISEAKATVAKAVAIEPKAFDMYVRQRVPWMRPSDHAIMVDDLVKAGWQQNHATISC
jgi:adenylate cyclase